MNRDLAELFRRISLGVYIVGVASPEQQHAFTASWIMPVSFNPLLLALSINPQHRSYAILKESGQFTVSVLVKIKLISPHILGYQVPRSGSNLLRSKAASGVALFSKRRWHLFTAK